MASYTVLSSHLVSVQRRCTRTLLVLSVFVVVFACDDGDSDDPVADATLDAAVPAADISLPDVSPPDVDPPESPELAELTSGSADAPGADDLTSAVEPGSARAGRVDSDEERLRGPQGRCRLGDFRLDNAVISACIQDADSFSILSFSGGNLIDLHRADRPSTDEFQEILHAPALGGASVERIGIVRDGRDGGTAVLRTEGRAEPLRLIQGVLPNVFLPPDMRVVTEYRLAPDDDGIDVYTWLVADRGGAGTVLMADVVFFGDATRPFVPAGTSLAFIGATQRDVSYVWTSLDGPVDALPLPIGDLQILPIRAGNHALADGDAVLVRRRIRCGTGDIEAIRPIPADAEPMRFSGPAGALVDIDGADGPVTRVRLDEQGAGVARLMPGTYTARVGEGENVAFDMLGADPDTVVHVPTFPTGTLTVRVRDADTAPIAAKLVLRGPAPEMTERLVFAIDDPRIELRAGTWSMETSRGWHYTVDVRDIEVADGEETPVDVVLEHVLPTPGWTSGEFHQHATPSIDSAVSVVDRVRSNMVEGVGFMVPSEHDVVFDYGEVARAMGVQDHIGTPILGTEISPIYGHMGAYGLDLDLDAPGFGGIPLSILDNGRWRVREPPELIALARAHGAEILQINHGRDNKGWFDHVGFEPHIDVSTLDPALFTDDFDTMEVFNSRGVFCRLMADWMGLLNQGLRVTAVGNSDTHERHEAPGYPRNYLPTLADHPAGVTRVEVVDALRLGTVTVGGGAVMDFPTGPQPGDTVEGGSPLSLHVRIRTPPFTRVTRLVVFHNGDIVVDDALDPDEAALIDFDDVVEVPVGADGHVVVYAEGDMPMPHANRGERVFALANAIAVDVDGGGVRAPGPRPVVPPDLGVCR